MSYGGARLCRECREKRYKTEVAARGEKVQHPSDFKEWKSSDMSELFWIHLGEYIKDPNPRSISIMYTAYLWACHDNQGLANSFRHALKWAKIDLNAEVDRWKSN